MQHLPPSNAPSVLTPAAEAAPWQTLARDVAAYEYVAYSLRCVYDCRLRLM